MYRPAAYVCDDLAALHAVIRGRRFATIAGTVDGGVVFGYAPVVLDAGDGLGRIRFHLAKANPLCRALRGAGAIVSFLAADAYISPDWYEGAGFVPTWNYIAVEGEGRAETLDGEALLELLDDLSAQEEAELAPKPVWTMAKLSSQRRAMLLAAIDGFSLVFDRLEGKFKLGQEKPAADRQGAIDGLAQRGDPASLAIAAAMRK